MSKENSKKIPDFKPGDILSINVNVKEGQKVRQQLFKGTVIARKGSGVGETITVRKVSNGIGVERIFPLHSPSIASIKVNKVNKVRKGSVTLSIKIDSKNQFKVKNHEIESFLKAYKDIEKKYNLKLDYNRLFSSNDLVRFSTSDKAFDNKILKAVNTATNQAISMRVKEGNDIQKEFLKYIAIAKKDLHNIQSIYLKEVTKLANGKSNSDSKIEDIEKLDITEEIDRTKSHFNQIQSSIKSKELSGKKINFILQEINRESNTILSKFLNKKIAKNAISLKIQTEKLREQ